MNLGWCQDFLLGKNQELGSKELAHLLTTSLSDKAQA